MWSMEPNEISSLIFRYKSGSFESIRHNRNDTCEEVCKDLCQKWDFPPLVQLLFGLRVYGKQIWLAESRPLVKGEKYEFRIRFKTPKLADLNQLNREAYDYLYHQMRHDVLCNSIPEIVYPNHKNAILGLCVSSMYVDMKETKREWDYYKRNCKHYIPKKLYKQHIYFAKDESLKKLKDMSNVDYDPLYVKSIYINQIESKAPSYMIEEYNGTTDYPPEDNLKGQCRVRFQIAPYHDEQPGLRMLYEYKGTWKHIAKFADFYTIQIDRESNIVSLEIQNSPVGVLINMESCEVMESFVSCLCTYYRLSTKWDTELCASLGSPSLKFLSELKIHGPIGGTYSYSKLEDRNAGIGAFIIRQCEKIYDTYYIDIITKENQPETFKIHYNCTNGEWTLFENDNDNGSVFNVLTDLAKSIHIDGIMDAARKAVSKHFRVQPSPHDKSPLLLLCQTSVKTASISASVTPTGLQSKNPLLLNAANDLLLYKWEVKDYSDNIFMRMRAEYLQPNGKKKKNVTLKILKQTEVANKLSDFLKLADMWGKLDLSEIVHMHGLTLHQPIALVLESISHGPLDEFLRSHKDRKYINVLNLVETAFSLAKALHYLQENKIVHGRIRCSSLEVTQFSPERQFVVKLGDPGIPNDYNINDVPWIPIEYYENLEESRTSAKADIWAYSTTLWEIFSRGTSPLHEHTNFMNFFVSGSRLAKPHECSLLPAIYNLMLQGWDSDPERRPLTQIICSILVDAKTKLSRNYAEPHQQTNGVTSFHGKSNGVICNGNSRHNNNNYHSEYNNSIRSAETENTYVPSCPSTITTTAYIENGGSSNGGSSQVSLLNGNSPNGSGMTLDHSNYDDFFDEYLSASGVLEFDNDTKIIFQGEEGRGNHGLVYKGTLETHNEDGLTEIKVAIKRLLHIDTGDISAYKDFVHEAKLMKKLQHENIVKIYGFMETPLIIIMEFMPRTLHRHLNIHRSELRVEHLLKFAEDIAKGMRYLELHKIVHRDLAARNVLVSSDKVIDAACKISDFGLAQVTNHNGYYVYNTLSRKLPLKWYAPECIENRRFSSKSDVWSYAVTLYEMFSFGDSPNLVNDEKINTSAEAILNLLKEGRRLGRPPICPPHVYEDLMMPCWNINSQQRPTFGAILQRFPNLSPEQLSG